MRKLKSHYSQPATTGNARERGAEFRGRERSGHAVVEMALMAPWIFLLFIMVFDLGFYNYAAIATANAARSGMVYTTRSSAYVLDTTMACQIALRELQGMPNVSSTTTCAASKGAITDASPVAVELYASAGPDGTALGAGQVAVTYRSPQLFPIPGLMGRMTITRVAEGRIRDN